MAEPAIALALLLLAVVLVGRRALRAAPAVGPAETPLAADFTAAERARARALFTALLPSRLAGSVLSLVWVLVAGFGPPGRVFSRTGAGHPAVALLVVLVVVLGGAWLLSLPFAIAGRRVRARYGLTAGGWGGWLLDRVKSLLLTLVLAAAALAVLLWLRAVLGPAWWWVAVPAAALAIIALTFVVPVLVEPLFLRLRPLPASAERTALLDLARAAGLAVRDVLVADASRRTTAYNAYVSGFGPTRRVVVFDTLLSGERFPAVRAVVAHELGHVARADVAFGAALGALGGAAAVAGLAVLLAWEPVAAGTVGVGVVPFTLAYLAGVGLVTNPAQSAYSRRVEARADRYALDLLAAAGEDAATAYAAMLRALARAGVAVLEPPRAYVLWAGTHPSIPQRLAATRRWAGGHGTRVADRALE